METFVLRDDVSWAGLRRYHGMRPGEAVEEAAVLEAMRAEGGELLARLAWVDEDLGNHHLYLAWRCQVEAMFVATMEKKSSEADYLRALQGAIGRAAAGYEAKAGRLPNRAVVRDPLPGPAPFSAGACTAFENGGGEKTLTPGPSPKGGGEMQVMLVDGEGKVVGVVVVGTARWLKAGDVGVFFEEANDDDDGR